MICHYTTRLDGGGAETQLLEVANGISIKYGTEQVVFYTCVEDLDFFKSKYDELSFREIGRNFIPENKPEVLHHVWIPNVFLNIRPWRFPVETTIIGIRNIYGIDSLRRLYQYIVFCRFKFFVGNTDKTLHNYLYRALFNTRYYETIFNKLKYPDYQKGVKSKNSFLYVGRLVKQKGLREIGEAARIAQVRVTALGKGPMQKELFDNTNVELLGHVKEVSQFYSKSEFLILGSYNEGMPNVAFEAISHGCIPLLSDIEVHRAWFTDGDNALFFPVGSAIGLAQCIQRAQEMSIREKDRILRNLQSMHLHHAAYDVIGKYHSYYERFPKNI